jgi:hypothetical protein
MDFGKLMNKLKSGDAMQILSALLYIAFFAALVVLLVSALMLGSTATERQLATIRIAALVVVGIYILKYLCKMNKRAQKY